MSTERYEQPHRWLGEGLEALGSGIAWAGFWIGLGIMLGHAPALLEKLL